MPWHLRIGQQIVNEHAAPTVDYYDHTLLGKSWVDHEWLFNAIFYYLYNTFGYISLNIFFAVLITLTFIILQFFTQLFFIDKYLKPESSENLFNKGMLLIMSLEAYALVALAPFIGVRMQIAGNLLFILILFLLELFDKNQQKKYLLVIPFVFILWANLHGSFLIGLAILWSWLGLKTIEPLIRKYQIFNKFEFNLLSKKNIIFAYGVIISATLATLINPYGIQLYSFLGSYKNSYYLSAIAEWRPFYYLPILYNQLIFLAIFLAILILSIYALNKKNTTNEGFKKYVAKLNLYFIFLSILFFILALKSKRHFPLFLMSSFALIVQFLYFEFTIEIKNNFSKIFTIAIKILLILMFSGISSYCLANAKITNDPFVYQPKSPLPYKLVEFLKNNPNIISKKIFNDYSWGGYFLWMMPKAKLFIDGRMPQIEYNGHSLLEEYADFFKKGEAEEQLTSHKIELVILRKDEVISLNKIEKKFLDLNEDEINNQENYLQDFLQSSDSWDKIYEDNLGEIYILK